MKHIWPVTLGNKTETIMFNFVLRFGWTMLKMKILACDSAYLCIGSIFEWKNI